MYSPSGVQAGVTAREFRSWEYGPRSGAVGVHDPQVVLATPVRYEGHQPSVRRDPGVVVQSDATVLCEYAAVPPSASMR